MYFDIDWPQNCDMIIEAQYQEKKLSNEAFHCQNFFLMSVNTPFLCQLEEKPVKFVLPWNELLFTKSTFNTMYRTSANTARTTIEPAPQEKHANFFFLHHF